MIADDRSPRKPSARRTMRQRDAEDGHEEAPRREAAEGDGRAAAGGDDARVVEADEGDEEPDADAIAFFRSSGIAFMTCSRRPVSTSSGHERALHDDDAHRFREAESPPPATRPKASSALMPRPGAMA